MTKQARQFAIKEIVSSRSIANQDELRVELEKRGHVVTQATLSRDMKDVGMVRMASSDGARYVLQAAPEPGILRPLVGAEVVSVAASESVIVIRTLPACANTVGEFIDNHRNPDIIGTVAGDNTLLVIPSSIRKTRKVVAFLKQQLFEGV